MGGSDVGAVAPPCPVLLSLASLGIGAAVLVGVAALFVATAVDVGLDAAGREIRAWRRA